MTVLPTHRDETGEEESRTRLMQEPVTAKILEATASPTQDILAERSRGTIDVQAMAEFLNGGKARLERRRYLALLLKRQPWAAKLQRLFYSRTETHVKALEAGFELRDLVLRHGLSSEDYHDLRIMLDFPGGLELHYGMYIPTLQTMATEEQKERFLKPALEFREIGTYAQTELGHGTFLRGLETTAIYDPQSEEFVLHSPTLTAAKWWPGGLGKTATHAVVMARLFLSGKDYGPHPFVVQLRDLQTHRALPGIVVGDIGPKLGYNGVDNGFLRFDHLRIPRDNMLMRYSQVTPEGRYVPPPKDNAKASYGTMMYIRATIVEGAGHFLSRAVTIATRFCAVRRQTAPRAGVVETQVLDYQTVQWNLMRLLATSYALLFQGRAMMRLYRQYEEGRERGDFSILPELHPLSSGLKAVTSWMAADGIEECRLTCGGQGYSVLSGLPQLLASYVQNCTWEGDNNVMCLQMARFLVKQMHAALSGPRAPAGQCAYFAATTRRGTGGRAAEAGPAGPALRLLEEASVSRSKIALQRLQRAPGAAPEVDGERWGANGVPLVEAARAHCRVVLAREFWEEVGTARAGGVGAENAKALGQMAELFTLEMVRESLPTLLADGALSGQAAGEMQERQEALVRELRLNAVPLVDAFAHEDYILASCIGREDGDVYRALYEAAQASPLNDTEEGPAWEPVLRKRLGGEGAVGGAMRSRM